MPSVESVHTIYQAILKVIEDCEIGVAIGPKSMSSILSMMNQQNKLTEVLRNLSPS